MTDLPADLAKAVNAQAQARVEMNIGGYAKYLTPEAIDTLRASFPGVPPRVNRYAVDAVEVGGSDYTVDVRYFVRDESFVVRSRWRTIDGAWMVATAERLWIEGEKRPGFLSRLAGSVLRWISGLRRGR
jgi:hypothetical protein